MATTDMPSPDLDTNREPTPHEKHQDTSKDVRMHQVHTPPTTDEGSHKDDDAASSSSLSDLGDVMEDEENTQRFEDAARAGAEAEQFSEVKPDRYENNIPIFQPTMEEFRDFKKYMTGVDPYGMQSGIVLIDPPEEWKRARKALDELTKFIKIKNPLTQEFHGAQGIYTQRNMEKMRTYNLPQWKALCEQTENQPPARRGEKRLNADKLLGRGSTKNKRQESSPLPEGVKRKPGRPPKYRAPIKEEPVEDYTSLKGPPTPTSPELEPANTAVKQEEDQADADGTPVKGKRGRKPGAQPKGRQPRSTKADKSGGKGEETTVAARRLRNVRAAADEIDEEAFQDFDYRVYDNDQWTAERCDELEDKYWKSLNFSNPMYAADMPGSLFDEGTKEWNVAKLPNLLDLLGQPIPGVNTAYLYLGMWRATFAWHLEDVDLYSINYIHFGAPKQWYSISQKDAPKFEAAMRTLWPSDAKNCSQFLRHKTYLISPSVLKSKFGVTVNKIVHREGQFVVTFPIGYHSGYNLGYNCAESVNFALENWLQYGKTARKCECEADSVFIDVDWFVRRLNGEPSPEYEEVEVTDDEDEDELMDISTSTSGKKTAGRKRKLATKDQGPNKKAKKIIKIRKVSKNQPCCLCPNDPQYEELLPTTHGKKAHRVCAMYTPETYIATKDGNEMIFNIENISSDRLALKCYECRQKKGSYFQCSSDKCVKAYHATCAMQAGVQVDKGEIAIWHEGKEYRDIGFDWRCKLHRTVKRTRVTSDTSTYKHISDCWANPEFLGYITKLQPGDLIQWQATHADDIRAGVVVSGFDPGQNSILVKNIPEQKKVVEVDPSFVLFVDSTTSRLQKPSANALDLPEELQGMTASIPESTEKLPAKKDPFTENPHTEWEEFVRAEVPHNSLQKPVDLQKEKQLWLYLGASSTETTAHYTADPTKPVHDPSSVFLVQVQPPKTIMAPPPQPRRQSLAATYPAANIAARNAAMTSLRQAMAKVEQNRPQTTITPPNTNRPDYERLMNAAREKVQEMQRVGQAAKTSQVRDILAGAEARANELARIQQRQEVTAKLHTVTPQPYHFSTNSMVGMSIDQDAVNRQRQFQQLASQQSRSMSMNQNSANPTLPQLRQWHEPLPDYNAIDTDRPRQQSIGSGSSPYLTQLQHSPNWMNGINQDRRPSYSPISSPSVVTPIAASPPNINRPSPMVNGNEYANYGHQAHGSNGYQTSTQQSAMGSVGSTEQMRPGSQSFQSAHMDYIRNAVTQPPPPPPSAALIRARRISNPAYPFKSPDRIKAQKEASQSSPSGSRPTSSYDLPSPVIKPEPLFPSAQTMNSVDVQNPPQFINPNATQISPPGSNFGRPRTMSTVTTVAPMVQMHPQLRRTLSTGIDNAVFPTMLPTHPKRPAFDPLSFVQPLRTHQARQHTSPPIAEANAQLVAALQPRPTSNDSPLPAILQTWQAQGGFWNRVANQFARRHNDRANVYRSPFGLDTLREDRSLAERYYDQLEGPSRETIDFEKQNGMKM